MRVAVFVDAGYLYAAGSSACFGKTLPRDNVSLDVSAVIDKLKEAADALSDGAKLLRIYWYDGALVRQLSNEHRRIADADDVKLRLGVVTPHGKQKGVDSLVVTDLIDLARNRAVSDAVLLSGDEDTRIGVQIAQSFGVRVHLVGIATSSKNQSAALKQESDTTVEWHKADVETFMAQRGEFNAGDSMASDVESVHAEVRDKLAECVVKFVEDHSEELAEIQQNSPIPPQLDGKLLMTCGSRLNRWLDEPEKHYIRREFKKRALHVRDHV